MTTQTMSSVEIAINELARSIRYEADLNFTFDRAIANEGSFADAIWNQLDYSSEKVRVLHIIKGIALMRANLEMQINDLNTFEAEFEDAIKEAK